MALLSKLKNVTPIFKRRLTLPNNGLPLDPTPIVKEFIQEKHAAHLEPVVAIMIFGVILPCSVYAFYREYTHLIVHKHRIPFPKQYFLHAGINRWPNGDHKHSPMHHPYFNFTPHGYETDKDGNKLPAGEYAME